MKKTLLLLLAVVTLANAQEKYSPTLIVLNSQETVVAQELDSIAKTFIQKGLSNQAKKNIREENGDFKLKAEKEIEFLEETDIASNITYGLNYFLSYKVFEHFQNLLIYPANETHNSSHDSLKKISEKHDVNWVVNLKRIEFFTDNNELKAKIDYQLYNQKVNEIVISNQFVVGDKNPGFEFACQSGSLSCVINNSIRYMSNEILSFMWKDKKYWR